MRPNQGKQLDYETMSLPDIFDLLDRDIFSRMEEQHTIFMWTVDQFLPDTESMMKSRGYRLHCRFIWNKMNGTAPAFTIRYCHEYLLWFYKPKMTPVAIDQRGKYSTVIEEKSRQHSRKPEASYTMIQKLFPLANKFDVFSREKRDGWAQYGNQMGHFT